MRRRGAALPALAVLAAVLLGLGVVAGCGNPFGGGDDTGAYCSALDADREEFAEMLAAGSPAALMQRLPMLRDLAAAAPSDLRDEWQVLLAAVEGLEDALADAGLEPDDYVDGKPPAGLERADRRAVRAAADTLSAAGTVSAAAGIEQQARDVCKINLGM